MPVNLRELSRKLGYEFKNLDFLEQALTHRSLESKNNERMEFLGDSIINFIIAESLFNLRKTSKEGELSRFRASLVNRDSLAEIANQFDLSDYLRMGTGELRSGGFRRPSILADALEAIVCAIYFDSDITTCKVVLENWFKTKLHEVIDAPALKDPKTQLQELLQAKKMNLPNYELLQVTGEHHQQNFVIKCTILDLEITATGEGNTRRKAEQAAAELCLEKLKDVRKR